MVERGIAETQGWQTARLYDLACETHARRGQPLEVLGLRRSEHRMPSLSTYSRLRRAAEAVDAWAIEVDAARAVLCERDPRAFVEALLGDGEAQLAWDTAQAAEQEQLGSDLWLQLAESRETASPTDAVAVYQRVADEVLEKTDRRAYAAAVRILKRGETPRRQQTTLSRSVSTSPRSASNTVGARP